MEAVPELVVGDPVRHRTLTVFPLFTRSARRADYLLGDEALAQGLVKVEEVGESGSVPNLQVNNQSGRPVLFLEGEELAGAKQNRVLNTSVLVATGQALRLPVSCVEQGRWSYRSPSFSSTDTCSSTRLRRIIKETVTESLHRGGGHRSSQDLVWREVGRQQMTHHTLSDTHAMSDTYQTCRFHLDEFKEKIPYVAEAAGVAVAIGGQIVAVDWFDQPGTCEKVWGRLLTGYAMDALESPEAEGPPGPEQVRELLQRLRQAAWEGKPAAGVGQEYRAKLADGTSASLLTVDDTVVHGSAILPIAAE